MKRLHVLTPSFRDLGRQAGLKAEVFEGRLVVSSPMWRKALSTDSGFCRALVDCGYLSERQMLRAALRYRLGATRQGGVIFWQIDAQDVICDGKVMYYREDCHRDKRRHPTWVSTMLSRRYRWADAERLSTRHCLFGLHLLGHTDGFKPHTDGTDGTDILKPHTDGTESFKPHTDILKPHTDGFKPHTDGTDYTDYSLRQYVQNNNSTSHSDKNSPNHVVSKDIFEPTSKHEENQICEICEICEICVTKNIICVVEAEKTAVIMSEHFPQCVWLATGGLGNVQVERFRPLRGHEVVLFPDTDPEGKAFTAWCKAAQLVMRQPFWEGSPPITVSPLLERHATAAQKREKIDLVDFLFPHTDVFKPHTDYTDYTDIYGK